MPKLVLNGDELDRLWVRAVELFPTDLDTAKSCFAVETLKAKIEGEAADSKLVVDVRTLRLMLDAPSYADLRAVVVKNTKRAIVAGDILAAMYLMHKFALPEPSFNKAIFVAMQYAKTAKYGDGKSLAVSEPTIRSCWDSYKSVAHFWAAFRLSQDYPFADKDSPGFFAVYLQVAQGLLEFGTSYVPKRARPPQTILSRNDCWVLPDTIKAKHLTPICPPDGLLKYLKKYKAPKSRV